MQEQKPWSLVIQRVTTHSVDIWFGNLWLSADTVPLPQVRVVLTSQQGHQVSHEITQWQCPYQDWRQGLYATLTLDELQSSERYQVTLSVLQGDGYRLVQQGEFVCLPMALPSVDKKPFTIAFGSCFSNQDDNGQVSAAYAALYEHGEARYRPDITMLLGDQVYLDIGFASLVPIPGFIRRRIANRYATNWAALSGVFTRGGTWMLPDDHEYWNDYPFNNLPILALQALKLPFVRRTWEGIARDAATHIQGARALEVINIGDDLSICIANMRSQRTSHKMLGDEAFAQLLAWAKGLTSVGVLVVQQVLMDTLQEGERNLPSFAEQYAALIEALAATGNDILVLSGDVHFGRIASVSLGNKGVRLVEAVSSPLSNLKGPLNGLGADVAHGDPHTFPVLPVTGVPAALVDYDKDYQVGSVRGKSFSNYPKDRTREHFMTASFSRAEEGGVDIAIQAWQVRAPDPQTGTPSEGFTRVFQTRLKTG